MPTPLNREKIRRHLEECDLHALFIEELGWDHGGENTAVTVADKPFVLEAIAHKRGLVVYQHIADTAETFPDHPTRQKIEKAVARTVREHLIVYAPPDRSAQHWQWVKREPGKPDRQRSEAYHQGEAGERLIQKLEQIVFTLDEENDLTIVDVSGRVRAAFDVEKVTRKFYDRFKQEHRAFLDFIEGIQNIADREWYASLMLNRMMFIYFIQKRGFLDSDPDYLRNRLHSMQTTHGKDRFQTFYRLFLLRLFHEGLGQPEADRSPELTALLGRVPYLNGGLFDVHDLERDNAEIHIPDEAFAQIFAFFDAYQWHLDDRLLRNDNEINPDVLGYIFEKYINQKQMGAYYTKEDITGYISRNTIIPFLFDQAKKACPIAFTPGGGVWRPLSDDPDRYFYEAVRHGITYDIHAKEDLTEKRELPANIAAGLNAVSKRDGWNRAAPADYALPTETWREHVARRQRYEEVRAKLVAGEVTSINDLITYNLDIEKFAHDVIVESEGPELIRAFWKALNAVSVLDPTCGSGAFLFAALNILEPLYTACLEVMRSFLDDLERSQRTHRPEKLRDFRSVLEQVAAHPSESYFILKSIIVNNLYGVDIMEEAVEICKLRLFLKLVAQLERYEQIEPLPDVDFNVRAGNTLVGFTSLDEVKKVLSADLIKQLSLPQIEERAEIANRAFRKFRAMQTEYGMDAGEFAATKVELRKRLDDLRNELDQYLAGDYGVKVKSKRAYQKWRDSHQPFHWFVEFYGIMQGGGFDVIIGNPPWKEYSAVKKTYVVRGYETEKCGNLHGFCTERSLNLTRVGGKFSFIVQLPLVCSSRMGSLRRFLRERTGQLHLIPFDDRPGKLFEGLQHCRSVIFIAQSEAPASKRHLLLTSRYQRWHTVARSQLFSQIQYARHRSPPIIDGIFPKCSADLERSVFQRMKTTANQTISHFMSKAGTSHFVFYQEATQYWMKATFGLPYYSKNDNVGAPAHGRYVYFPGPNAAHAVCAVMNSSLFYAYFIAYGDCFHLSDSLVSSFPVTKSVVKDITLTRLNKKLMDGLRDGAEHKTIKTRDGDVIAYAEYYASKCKQIIDEIDQVLAKYYGFTDEELDFIINYDIKYRMGRDG